MEHAEPSYGLWTLVVLNVAIFVMFAFSFFKPASARDWRSFGAFTAFIVALFVEMYGFPLTIYVLSGWLGQRFPGVDLLNHNAGHLLELLFGWGGDPHLGPFHILSYLFIGGGFWLLAAAWPVLYEAQRQGRLAHTGVYARIRHPQYIAFVLIMFGFLLSMADTADAVDVPGTGGDVRPPGAQRGTGKRTPFWTGLGGVCAARATFHPALGCKGAALSHASDDKKMAVNMKLGRQR